MRLAAIGLSIAVLAACSRSRSSAQSPMETTPTTGSGAAAPAAPAPQMPANEAPPPTQVPPGGGGGVDQGNAPAPRGAAIAPTTGAAEPRGGTANPFDEHGSVAANTLTGADCQRDEDCVCGLDRSTGACAVGTTARVDPARQCPDFCGGITGQLRLVCDHGRCAQH